MPRADLLVKHAGQLLTMRGPDRPRRGAELSQLGLVRDGALAIRAGRILAAGRTREVASRFRAARVLDAEGGVVMPGFVDAHTHLPFVGTREFELPLKLAGRSYLEILRAGGGIHHTVKRTRMASRAELVAAMRPRLATMLAWGTTTAEAKSGYGLRIGDEVKQLEAVARAGREQPVELVPTLLAAHVVPPEFQRRRSAYVDEIVRRMLPLVARRSLAEFCDAFLEQGAFRPPECARILRAAKQNGLGTRLHADEFTNRRGAELAARLGCDSAEHLLRVSARGVRALARSETIAVLLPGVSITGLLGRFAPARALVDAGAAVALGTDFNPNCHVLTMPTVLQWAVFHLRLRPEEALVAATVNAAAAVGRLDRLGTLTPGKQADVLILHHEDYLDAVYRVGENPVAAVLKAGRRVAG